MRMPRRFSLSCQVRKNQIKKGLQMHRRDILLESMSSELFLWLRACVYRNVCVCAWEGKRNRRRLKWSDSTCCTLLRFPLFFFFSRCLQEFSSATNQLSPNPQPHTQTQTRSTLVLQLWWPFPSRLRGKPHSISHKTLTGCEGVCNPRVKEQSVTN